MQNETLQIHWSGFTTERIWTKCATNALLGDHMSGTFERVVLKIILGAFGTLRIVLEKRLLKFYPLEQLLNQYNETLLWNFYYEYLHTLYLLGCWNFEN